MGIRLIFAGTPQIAVPTLEALLGSDHQVVGVITRSPKRRGRSKALVPSPVAQYAAAQGLTVLETDRPNDADSLAWLASLDADLGVVVAFGALLRPETLTALPQGWINLHFSTLPDLRGAAPVQRALLRGDTTVGCSVFQLEAGMDTGPVFLGARFEVGAATTSGEALTYLSSAAAPLVISTVDQIEAGTITAQPQDIQAPGAVTMAPKLRREDGFIDFAADPLQVVNRVRAVTPEPGAWTTLPGGAPLKIRGVRLTEGGAPTAALSPGSLYTDKCSVYVQCQGLEGEGHGVVVDEVAPAGKKWMRAADWWRGARLTDGVRLGVDGAPGGESNSSTKGR